MGELISRKAALDALLGERPLSWADSEAELAEGNQWEYDYAAIEAVPAVDAVPVIHAHLIYHDDEFDGRVAECSNCHTKGMLYGNYCVFCGAKLDGKEK